MIRSTGIWPAQPLSFKDSDVNHGNDRRELASQFNPWYYLVSSAIYQDTLGQPSCMWKGTNWHGNSNPGTPRASHVITTLTHTIAILVASSSAVRYQYFFSNRSPSPRKRNLISPDKQAQPPPQPFSPLESQLKASRGVESVKCSPDAFFSPFCSFQLSPPPHAISTHFCFR